MATQATLGSSLGSSQGSDEGHGDRDAGFQMTQRQPSQTSAEEERCLGEDDFKTEDDLKTELYITK